MARRKPKKKPLTTRRLMILAALILVAVLARNYLKPTSVMEVDRTRKPLTVEKAAAEHISGVMIDAVGEVSRVLADDQEGSRHQRFIVEMPSGHTVLVSHNIDLAPRVPLSEGDRVTVHGQFEWNDRGGVLHWTHHDPAGRHEGGWVEHQGKKYQ